MSKTKQGEADSAIDKIKNDLHGDDVSLESFDVLLGESDDIEPRLKSLWTEIYRNARDDREQANIFLTDLIRTLSGSDADKHTLHGPQAVRYLERIGKANEQLLKLADQIKAYRESQGKIDSDALMDEIATV